MAVHRHLDFADGTLYNTSGLISMKHKFHAGSLISRLMANEACPFEEWHFTLRFWKPSISYSPNDRTTETNPLFTLNRFAGAACVEQQSWVKRNEMNIRNITLTKESDRRNSQQF